MLLAHRRRRSYNKFLSTMSHPCGHSNSSPLYRHMYVPGRVPRRFLRGAGGGICVAGGVGCDAVATGSAWSSVGGRFLDVVGSSVGLILRVGPLVLGTWRRNLESSESMDWKERERGPPSGAISIGGKGGSVSRAGNVSVALVLDKGSGHSRESGSCGVSTSLAACSLDSVASKDTSSSSIWAGCIDLERLSTGGRPIPR